MRLTPSLVRSLPLAAAAIGPDGHVLAQTPEWVGPGIGTAMYVAGSAALMVTPLDQRRETVVLVEELLKAMRAAPDQVAPQFQARLMAMSGALELVMGRRRGALGTVGEMLALTSALAPFHPETRLLIVRDDVPAETPVTNPAAVAMYLHQLIRNAAVHDKAREVRMTVSFPGALSVVLERPTRVPAVPCSAETSRSVSRSIPNSDQIGDEWLTMPEAWPKRFGRAAAALGLDVQVPELVGPGLDGAATAYLYSRYGQSWVRKGGLLHMRLREESLNEPVLAILGVSDGTLQVEQPPDRLVSPSTYGEDAPHGWGLHYVAIASDALGMVKTGPLFDEDGMTRDTVEFNATRLMLPVACVAACRVEETTPGWDGQEHKCPPQGAPTTLELDRVVRDAEAAPGQIVAHDAWLARQVGDRTWIALPPDGMADRVRDVLLGFSHERAIWNVAEPANTILRAWLTLVAIGVS
ncbi:MAG: hypothetical protein ACYCZN_02055 [Candidatus Dormibacteria bacterium]